MLFATRYSTNEDNQLYRFILTLALTLATTAASAQGLYDGDDARVVKGNPTIIQFSPGGSVEQFLLEVDQLWRDGTRVIVDGPCMSACTMVTALPNACATPRGILGFHEAFTEDEKGNRTPSKLGTELMASHWSKRVRQWLARRHLTLTIQTVSAAQLMPACNLPPAPTPVKDIIDNGTP